MNDRRNYLALFSEEELTAALSNLATPDVAHEVAASVYAIPLSEQVFFDWLETTLMLFALVSEDCKRRVIENFGAPDETHFLDQIQEVQQSISVHPLTKMTYGLEISDVVYDSRLDEHQ